MSCIVRFDAPDCDIDELVTELDLDIGSIYRQGEPMTIRRRGNNKRSGLTLRASEAEFDDFKQQVADAIAFITINLVELCKLGRIASRIPKSRFYFDFGINTRMFDVGVQIDCFPTDLVRLIAEIGAGLVLSQYPPSDDEEEEMVT